MVQAQERRAPNWAEIIRANALSLGATPDDHWVSVTARYARHLQSIAGNDIALTYIERRFSTLKPLSRA